MKKQSRIIIPNIPSLFVSYGKQKFHLILVLLAGMIFLQMQQTRSEEIFLKCTGKYEINRGALIKPDWETSYIAINLDGLMSTIVEKGIKKEGETFIRRNSYTVTHKGNENSTKKIYRVDGNYNIYRVKSTKNNRILIGTCQKGRG